MKKFSKNNKGFTCIQCKTQVPPATKTSRNHCPKCLHSIHVDIFPGDRANPCGGILIPVGYETESKRGLMIHFECKKCGQKGRNKALLEDQNMADSYDAILEISRKSPKN